MRASVNVVGDAFGVGIVAFLSQEELEQSPRRVISSSTSIRESRDRARGQVVGSG